MILWFGEILPLLEELMKQVSNMREHYRATKAGLVEKASVVSYLDE